MILSIHKPEETNNVEQLKKIYYDNSIKSSDKILSIVKFFQENDASLMPLDKKCYSNDIKKPEIFNQVDFIFNIVEEISNIHSLLKLKYFLIQIFIFFTNPLLQLLKRD